MSDEDHDIKIIIENEISRSEDTHKMFCGLRKTRKDLIIFSQQISETFCFKNDLSVNLKSQTKRSSKRVFRRSPSFTQDIQRFVLLMKTQYVRSNTLNMKTQCVRSNKRWRYLLKQNQIAITWFVAGSFLSLDVMNMVQMIAFCFTTSFASHCFLLWFNIINCNISSIVVFGQSRSYCGLNKTSLQENGFNKLQTYVLQLKMETLKRPTITTRNQFLKTNQTIWFLWFRFDLKFFLSFLVNFLNKF